MAIGTTIIIGITATTADGGQADTGTGLRTAVTAIMGVTVMLTMIVGGGVPGDIPATDNVIVAGRVPGGVPATNIAIVAGKTRISVVVGHGGLRQATDAVMSGDHPAGMSETRGRLIVQARTAGSNRITAAPEKANATGSGR